MNALLNWLRPWPVDPGEKVEGGFLAKALRETGFQPSGRYPKPWDRFPRRRS